MKYQEKLRTERNRQGLSYKALAEKAGVSWRTIYVIETGQVSPSISTLAKIAEGLKTDLLYLLA